MRRIRPSTPAESCARLPNWPSASARKARRRQPDHDRNRVRGRRRSAWRRASRRSVRGRSSADRRDRRTVGDPARSRARGRPPRDVRRQGLSRESRPRTPAHRAHRSSPVAEGPLSLACLLPVRDGAADIARIPGVGRRARRLRGRARRRQRRRDGASCSARQPARRRACFETRRAPTSPAGTTTRIGVACSRPRCRAAGPDWVLFLDVDERIDADDAQRAARVHRQATRCRASPTGCELSSTVGSARSCTEPTPRLPAALARVRPRAAGRAAALQPCPGADPAARHGLRTTIRARHLDSPQRLQLRREKYASGRPRRAPCRAQRGDAPRPPQGPLREWTPRPPGLPGAGAERAATGSAAGACAEETGARRHR